MENSSFHTASVPFLPESVRKGIFTDSDLGKCRRTWAWLYSIRFRCNVHPLIHYWLIRQAAEQHNALRTRMSYLFDHIDSLKVPCMEPLIRLLCVPRVTSRWLSIMRKSYNYMDVLSMPSLSDRNIMDFLVDACVKFCGSPYIINDPEGSGSRIMVLHERLDP